MLDNVTLCYMQVVGALGRGRFGSATDPRRIQGRMLAADMSQSGFVVVCLKCLFAFGCFFEVLFGCVVWKCFFAFGWGQVQN